MLEFVKRSFTPTEFGKAVREGVKLTETGAELVETTLKNSDELAKGTAKATDLAASIKWKDFSKENRQNISQNTDKNLKI